MEREFIYLKVFEKNWYNLGLDDNDIEELENIILDNPNAGSIIRGTGGIRKLRFALPHRGKSGSVRVLYVDFISYEKTLFLNVYSKNQQDNIADYQKKELKNLIELFINEFKGVD